MLFLRSFVFRFAPRKRITYHPVYDPFPVEALVHLTTLHIPCTTKKPFQRRLLFIRLSLLEKSPTIYSFVSLLQWNPHHQLNHLP